MPLRLVLKPLEQLRVGTSQLTVVSEEYVTLIIDGDVPVLRERDFMRPEEAESPVQRLYLLLQTLYLSGEMDPGGYSSTVAEVLANNPEATRLITEVNNALGDQKPYRALRLARQHLLGQEADPSTLVSDAPNAGVAAEAARPVK